MKSYLEIASNDKKILIVDYLKGFSICTIVLMHLLYYMPSIPSVIKTLSAVGGTGVHVFFLCSGIGLYTSYLHNKTSFIEFIKKRFLKIYAPYIVVILISYFLPWMYSGESREMALLSHVLLFKMFMPQYNVSFGMQFWFVSTIIQLYILFIPMCLMKEKLKNNKLFALVFVGVSMMWWIVSNQTGIAEIRVWGSFCLQYIWEFAIGFVLADAFYCGKRYQIRNLWLLVLSVAGIGIQASMSLFLEELKTFNDVPALVGYASLALLVSQIPLVKKLCKVIAVFSYEFYLVHIMVFATIFHFAELHGLLTECVWACVAMIAALALAFCYNKLIQCISKRKEGRFAHLHE